ncbi:MAG: hypothetical protein PHG14_06335 [Desulfobacter postgatei]|uniref:hypothetical protein n=1 Tax=Desulfobacter postgatei TaxID=2293 RepID=UPI0023F38A69|nr:hypothetical protein [Desulfobacter postgatei]MDD4273331.1 hypothetical protein [Desulfobacter postgatei]
MEYYLRAEGVNLGNFVYDTSDLATIRGGSLLLLDAMDIVAEEIEKQIPKPDSEKIDEQINNIRNEIIAIKHDKKLSKKEIETEKKKLRKEMKKLEKGKKSGRAYSPTLTKGASWGLFKFQAELAQAQAVVAAVKKRFADDDRYRHACFVVNIYSPDKTDEAYVISRAKAQTLNRFEQLLEPSFALSVEGENICSFDKIRPADSPGFVPGEQGKDYISESVSVRRRYGQDVKRDPAVFYGKRTLGTDFSSLSITKDLEQLSRCSRDLDYSHLNNKMAVIYLDGNEFGKKQQQCTNPEEQRMFDQQTRTGREKLLRDLLIEITCDVTDERWFFDRSLRLETLLWGGDEIIWVVPAWQGWWMMKKFYQLAQDHIYLQKTDGQRETLYHGASLVFCKHKAPIQTIDSLSRTLADLFAKTSDLKKRNMFAYQVLESFDHAGSDIVGYRRMLIQGLSEKDQDLLIDAKDMETIEQSIYGLKQLDFPRRKIYQIVNCYRRQDSDAADLLIQKLFHETTADSAEEKRHKQDIKSLLDEIQAVFSGSPIFWLHLMELWDYVGVMQPATEQNEGDSSCKK